MKTQNDGFHIVFEGLILLAVLLFCMFAVAVLIGVTAFVVIGVINLPW